MRRDQRPRGVAPGMDRSTPSRRRNARTCLWRLASRPWQSPAGAGRPVRTPRDARHCDGAGPPQQSHTVDGLTIPVRCPDANVWMHGLNSTNCSRPGPRPETMPSARPSPISCVRPRSTVATAFAPRTASKETVSSRRPAQRPDPERGPARRRDDCRFRRGDPPRRRKHGDHQRPPYGRLGSQADLRTYGRRPRRNRKPVVAVVLAHAFWRKRAVTPRLGGYCPDERGERPAGGPCCADLRGRPRVITDWMTA